jgi:hypothetical protein
MAWLPRSGPSRQPAAAAMTSWYLLRRLAGSRDQAAGVLPGSGDSFWSRAGPGRLVLWHAARGPGAGPRSFHDRDRWMPENRHPTVTIMDESASPCRIPGHTGHAWPRVPP